MSTFVWLQDKHLLPDGEIEVLIHDRIMNDKHVVNINKQFEEFYNSDMCLDFDRVDYWAFIPELPK